ncbi:hypothetical protein [Aquirufa sp.]|uniref:hypothetical protein n=1 Tax=Aquirufa sp. TaxID=2676249 RepID=UPI0037C1873A
MSFLLIVGCNAPRIINLSTDSDIEDPKTLNISFGLKGELTKKYDVKMSIVNNLTKKEELVPNNEISPLPNNLLDSQINQTYKFIFKSNKYDFSNNIYSLKLIPSISKNYTPLSIQRIFFLNLGLYLHDQKAKERAQLLPHFSLGLLSENKKHIYSATFMRKPTIIEYVYSPSNFFETYDFKSLYADQRGLSSLGYSRKVYNNTYLGINLGFSVFNESYYQMGQVVVIPDNVKFINSFSGGSQGIRSNIEIGFNATYILKNFNCILNFSGFSYSQRGEYFASYISPREEWKKFFFYPTLSFGLGYNFKL